MTVHVSMTVLPLQESLSASSMATGILQGPSILRLTQYWPPFPSAQSFDAEGNGGQYWVRRRILGPCKMPVAILDADNDSCKGNTVIETWTVIGRFGMNSNKN